MITSQPLDLLSVTALFHQKALPFVHLFPKEQPHTRSQHMGPGRPVEEASASLSSRSGDFSEAQEEAPKNSPTSRRNFIAEGMGCGLPDRSRTAFAQINSELTAASERKVATGPTPLAIRPKFIVQDLSEQSAADLDRMSSGRDKRQTAYGNGACAQSQTSAGNQDENMLNTDIPIRSKWEMEHKSHDERRSNSNASTSAILSHGRQSAKLATSVMVEGRSEDEEHTDLDDDDMFARSYRLGIMKLNVRRTTG